MRERISYYSDGLKLSGILNTPDDSQGKRFPGVVLVPGYVFLVSCLCQVS